MSGIFYFHQMDKKDFFVLGKIIRTHGIKGGLVIFLDVDIPEKYLKLKSVFMEEGSELKEFSMEVISLKNNLAMIQIAGVDDINKAETFLKREVFLPLKFLAKPAENKFYIHEAFGFKVVDKTKGEIGIFEKVVELSGQNIAQVKFNEKEILFPLIPVFVISIDMENKAMQVDLPEGLVEMYLEK